MGGSRLTDMWPFQLQNQSVLAGILVFYVVFLFAMKVLISILMAKIPGFTNAGIELINRHAVLVEVMSKALLALFLIVLASLVINIVVNGKVNLF